MMCPVPATPSHQVTLCRVLSNGASRPSADYTLDLREDESTTECVH